MHATERALERYGIQIDKAVSRDMFGRHGWLLYQASWQHGRDTARDCCYCPARQTRASIFVPWRTVG